MRQVDQRLKKLFLICALLLLPLSGCIEKTIYPAAIVTVTTIDPIPIEGTFSFDASGSLSLDAAPLDVTLRCDNGIPCHIISCTITYQSRIGEPIPALTIENLPYEADLKPGEDTTVSFEVYTVPVARLLMNTPSDIAPLRVGIVMRIEDVNGNTIEREAHTLLSYPTS